MPILEYCGQNWFCNPFQSKFIGLSDSHHSLASPTYVKQKWWTLTPSGKTWGSIQSLVIRRCASAFSSGLPMNSSLKCDQFNCGIGAWIVCAGGALSCVGGAGSCMGGAEDTTGCITGGGWGAGGLPSAMSNYIINHATSESNPNFNWIYKWTKV